MRKTSVKVRNLLKKPQYAQKTPEWFAQRKTRMTASEVANCLTYSEIACSEYMRQFPHVPLKLNGKSLNSCLLYTSPSPRDRTRSRMPSSA